MVCTEGIEWGSLVSLKDARRMSSWGSFSGRHVRHLWSELGQLAEKKRNMAHGTAVLREMLDGLEIAHASIPYFLIVPSC